MPLGCRGASTTPDGPGTTLASPPGARRPFCSLSGGLEVPLGGRGVSTTSDGPGTPASPPDAERLGLLLLTVLSGGLEVPLGGKGASTTSDGPGPPVSPPARMLGLLDPEVINVGLFWNVVLISFLSWAHMLIMVCFT